MHIAYEFFEVFIPFRPSVLAFRSYGLGLVGVLRHIDIIKGVVLVDDGCEACILTYAVNMSIENLIKPSDEQFTFCPLHGVFVEGGVTYSIHLIEEGACIYRYGTIGTANRHIIAFKHIGIAHS